MLTLPPEIMIVLQPFMQVSQILLGLLVTTFVALDALLVVGADET